MVAAVEKSDLATALELHRRLVPVVRAVMDRSSQGAIRAKAALQILGVIPERTVRQPLLPSSDAEVDRLREVLGAAR